MIIMRRLISLHIDLLINNFFIMIFAHWQPLVTKNLYSEIFCMCEGSKLVKIVAIEHALGIDPKINAY